MICTSIQNKELAQIQALLEQLEMAEIRLDRCALEEEDIDELFGESDVPLVATCRLSEESQAPALLERAIQAGAKYVDLEMEAPAAIGRRIREACRSCGTVLIRSYHNYENTPSREVLLSILERARTFGGEVVKIVTTAHSQADVHTLESLYQEAAPGTLVAFCMGPEARQSRLDALKMGAPFTYACVREEDATAPGQWTTEDLHQAVYGDFRFVKAVDLPMPSSKSFAQRAIIAAALADGVSHLDGYSPCGDNESALAVAKALGAEVKVMGNKIVISGIGATPGCLKLEELHTGESGLLTRLMVPLLSALSARPVRVTGEKTLLNRPLSSAHDIMAAYGVRLYPEGNKNVSEERKADCYLPLKVAGPLIPGRADVSGKGGSQLISGLLAALPLMDGKSTVYVHEPRSIPYLFITVDVLKKFGIRIGSEMEGDDEFLETQDWSLCTGLNFHIKGGQRYQSADFSIEADWSGAAPFLTAGAIFGDVEVTGLDTTSLQADISILDILMQAGASMSQLDEPTGSIHIKRAPLSPFHADLNNCPDLFPMVAVLAAFCPGDSHLLGVQRLRHKETDRAQAIEEMLTQMDVPVQIDDDQMTITGMGLTQRLASGKLLKGGSYASHADHRMVMALKVASLGADSPVIIDDDSCVAKSFPGFNE
ncbi:MAG: type I 3-dehydroquinate dehydratase, partial [Bacteroidales bacterium]|nr:type I 3-dehydroquinate dehydratase [Bacteroidales bacterium]